MASTRSILLDSSVRHAIFVQRFAGSQQKVAIRYLERTRRAVARKLAAENLTAMSKRNLTKLLNELDAELLDIYNRMQIKLQNNLKKFGTYEAEFSTRMFNKASGAEFAKPADTLVAAAVLDRKIILTDEKLSVEQAFSKFSDKKRKQLISTITDGVIVGETTEQIVSKTTELTRTIQKHQSRSLITTLTNHVSSVSRDLVIEQNDDVIDAVEWVSTLDGRTTFTCQSLDGKIFPKNKGPRPPMHFGCRSTVIPKVKKEYSVIKDIPSERPSVGPGGAKGVSGNTTYQSWLSKQPKSFQEEVLGIDKAKLFRQGGLKLDAFVDENYEPLTLEQLKRKEPAAFEKAGLNEE